MRKSPLQIFILILTLLFGVRNLCGDIELPEFKQVKIEKPDIMIAYLTGGNWKEEKFKEKEELLRVARINTLVRYGHARFSAVSPEEGVFDWSAFEESLRLAQKHKFYVVTHLQWLIPPRWYIEKYKVVFNRFGDGTEDPGLPFRFISYWWLAEQIEKNSPAWKDMKKFLISYFRVIKKYPHVIGIHPFWRNFHQARKITNWRTSPSLKAPVFGKTPGGKTEYFFSGFDEVAQKHYNLPFPQPRRAEDYFKLSPEDRKIFLEWYMKPLHVFTKAFLEVMKEYGRPEWQLWLTLPVLPPGVEKRFLVIRGLVNSEQDRLATLIVNNWRNTVINNDFSNTPKYWGYSREWARKHGVLWTWELFGTVLGDAERHKELIKKYQPDILTFIHEDEKSLQVWGEVADYFIKFRRGLEN